MRKTICLLTGSPGIGKSLLLQQLLTASALGRPWLGRTVERANAFGIFAEDDQDELERRQIAINEHYEIEAPDLETALSWRPRRRGEARLVYFERNSDAPMVTPLWRQLWAHVAGEGVELVGLDTVAVVFGGNENFRGQVTSFMSLLADQADEINGAIVLNAHPSRSNPNSYSGSSAWLASCRAALSLQRPEEFDQTTGQPALERVLRGLKANYSGRPIADKLRWERGVFVAEEPDPPPRPMDAVGRAELDYRLLAGLNKVRANGGEVPADVMAPGSLPRRARAAATDLARVSLNALYDGTERLLQRGQVVRVKVKGKCLIRPADGPPYEGESAWEIHLRPL